MNSFLDKLGLYDFFSLVVGGMVFLLGLHYMELVDLQVFILLFESENWGISTVAILLISYLLGGCFNQIADKVFVGKYYRHLKTTILSKTDSVIGSTIKIDLHRRRACNILKEKGISIKEKDLNAEHSALYFTYCSYYLQTKGQHGKMEKLRGIMRLQANLVTCFALLIVCALYVMIATCATMRDPVFHCLFFSVILLVASYRSYKAAAKSWARIVVNAFDVCYDLENRIT